MALKPKPAEWVLLGYSLYAIGIGLSRVAIYPAAAWAIGAHLGVIALIGLFQSPGLGKAGRLLREVAPIGLLLALYGALDLLNGHGAIATHDATVRSWEATLFGSQVSRSWWQSQPSQLASTLLHAAYFSYYLIVPFPVLWHLASAQPGRASGATFRILLGFALCYAVFLALPVAGPYYEFPRPASWFLDNGAARAVYAILDRGSSYGAAFPSSHVAAVWISVAATAPGSRKWAAGLAVPAALMTAGVVYCQMHYAVDAVAGLVVAAVTIIAAGRIAPSS